MEQISMFDYLDREKYTVKSLFSGAGGMDLGMEEAGLTLAESYEYWDKACDTLANNFQHEVYKCDITKLLLQGQSHSVVITATFPCTHFSKAGLMDGDELYLEAHRIIRCLEPEIFVIENVPNMEQFPVVMEAFMGMPHYFVAKYILNAATFGAPQNRKRLIIIGSKQEFAWDFSPEKYTRHTLVEIIRPNVDVPLKPCIQNRICGINKGQWPAHVYDPRVRDYGPTCVAHYAKDQGDQLVVDPGTGKVRPFLVEEYAALQGFGPGYRFSGTDGDAYKQIGNAVSPFMSRAIGQEIVRYLDSMLIMASGYNYLEAE